MNQVRARTEALRAQLDEIDGRLAHLYDALESGKLNLDDLAPRIVELRERRVEINSAIATAEAEREKGTAGRIGRETALEYLEDLPKLLETASMEEKRTLLNSFIEGITKEAGGATIRYRLPVPQAPERERSIEVLDFDRGGGAEGSRTPDLLNAIEALSQLSYGPHARPSIR